MQEEPQLITVPTIPKKLKGVIPNDHRPSKESSVTEQVSVMSLNSDYQEKSNIELMGPDPFMHSGRPAIVIAPNGAPAILLGEGQGTQKVLLEPNEVVFIERDLFVVDLAVRDLLLTKCYMYQQDGTRLDMVIARELI